jgi:hypothetical protein
VAADLARAAYHNPGGIHAAPSRESDESYPVTPPTTNRAAQSAREREAPVWRKAPGRHVESAPRCTTIDLVVPMTRYLASPSPKRQRGSFRRTPRSAPIRPLAGASGSDGGPASIDNARPSRTLFNRDSFNKAPYQE